MPTDSLISRAALLSGCSLIALGMSAARADDAFLIPGSLVISSSAYDSSRGAVASLKVGTVLPNSATATTTAVSDNNYVTVWNNASVDASLDRKSTRLNSSHVLRSRMPSSA